MTRDKAQKQAARARMAKTGERYTTARHYLLDLHRYPSPENGAEQALANEPAAAPEVAAVADSPLAAPGAAEDSSGVPALPPRVAEPGMSDEAIQRGTGKGWDEWFALLDAWSGTNHNHTEIARHVHETYGIDGWWAQGVTVGYERARGMRARHERPDGFSMNASKTFSVPLARLFAAFVAEEQRAHWLEGVELRTRTSQESKSARFDVLPGDTRLAAYFTARGEQKASVALQIERLPSVEELERWKAVWKEQLARLGAYLSPEP
jgi:uncharacterized protein YndB with AHSA1/START domain